MHDLIIKNGLIADGTGAPCFSGDVAVSNGRIIDVGHVSGSARRTLNADGLLLTPGFVDIHTTACWHLPPRMASPPSPWEIVALALPRHAWKNTTG